MKQPLQSPAEATRARRVLAVVGLAVFLSVLDLFIVNIAFPDLRRDFPGAGLSGLSWVLTAYAIVFAATLVPAGRLGDLYGRRRLFVIGLALFTLGSALCAIAPSVEALVAARVLQGVGAAALTPNSLGLVLPMFPPEKRSTVIGAWAGIGAVGASIAPPLGGLLVEVSWRLIFLVNIPLGLIAIVLALRLAPEVRDARATRLPDLPGIAVLVAAVALLTLGLTQGQHWGWDARVWGAFAAAAILGAVFLRRCARHPAPVVELSLLRVPSFALAGLSTLLFSAGFAGLLLGNVLFFTQVWDYSILKAGIAFAPGPLLAATTAFTPAASPTAASPPRSARSAASCSRPAACGSSRTRRRSPPT
jgi:EmrB/QacA subfamily drug resistance transporter